MGGCRAWHALKERGLVLVYCLPMGGYGMAARATMRWLAIIVSARTSASLAGVVSVLECGWLWKQVSSRNASLLKTRKTVGNV